MIREETLARARSRVQELIIGFDDFLHVFEERNLFTGPSVYFHVKALQARRRYQAASDVLDDERFFDCVYATLASWGMHRMGPGNAKLVDIDVLRDSFRRQRSRIRGLEGIALDEIPESRVASLTSALWEILASLRVGIGETKIVANSKALHHVLPDLIPPIDRQYTLRFFFNHKTLTQGDEATFRTIYPMFWEIAARCGARLRTAVTGGMNSSKTQVIDNAIVGFVFQHLDTQSEQPNRRVRLLGQR